METRHVSHPSLYPRMVNAGNDGDGTGVDKKLEVGETLFPYLNDGGLSEERERFSVSRNAQSCAF